MKKTALIIMVVALLVPVSMFADGKATYEAKCKMCHGADGKKIAKADLSKPEADLVKFVTTDAKHKSKVADEATAKEVVAYFKSLK